QRDERRRAERRTATHALGQPSAIPRPSQQRHTRKPWRMIADTTLMHAATHACSDKSHACAVLSVPLPPRRGTRALAHSAERSTALADQATPPIPACCSHPLLLLHWSSPHCLCRGPSTSTDVGANVPRDRSTSQRQGSG